MKRRDAGVPVAILTVAAILLGGAALMAVSGATAPAASVTARAHAADIEERFRQGVVMLHAKRFDHAVAAFHQVLKYAEDLPEAHVNMGYALLGMKRFRAARDFFHSAIELRPRQMNAYYGLAVAHEGEGDLPAAIGAMRTYVHLAEPGDPHRRKAESALWEWQSSLDREAAPAAAAKR